MSKYSWDMDSLDKMIGWGKYKEMCLRDVVFMYPNYITWALRYANISTSNTLEEFLGHVLPHDNLGMRLCNFNAYYGHFKAKEEQIKRDRQKAHAAQQKKIEDKKKANEKKAHELNENQKLAQALEEQLRSIEKILKKTQEGGLFWEKKAGSQSGGRKCEMYNCMYGKAFITLRKESYRGREYEWKAYYSFILDIGTYRHKFDAPNAAKLWNYLESGEKEKQKIEAKEKAAKQTKRARKEIEFVDMVVKCHALYCEKNHHVEDVTAVFMVSKNGVTKQVEAAAGYCEECDCYFILESIFKKVKSHGRLLCQVVTEAGFKRLKNGMANFSDTWAEESPLKIAGYNVDARENLSRQEHRMILEYAVDSGLLTTSRVVYYIDGFISTRLNMSNMQTAISKWSEDRDYISEYKLGSARHVNVGKVTEKNWHRWYL